MNKPTMYEFLHAYMHNLYEALVDKSCSLSGLELDCDCCPFREACRAAAEAGDNLSCTDFIKTQIMDGVSYN